jgi:ornithine decarboxylase
VARKLAGQGLRVVLTGTAAETDLTRAVAAELGDGCLDLAGRTDLGALAALLAGCRLLVCNDTGVSHLADALRAPSVVVSTGDNPARWAPVDGRLHRVLCHPAGVRTEEVIAEAYLVHGVRTFSLDTMDELEKIVRATSTEGVRATDLNLLVRIRVDNSQAKLSLGAKFGAAPGEIKALLMAARQASDALGICFHVGSQAMSPSAYAEALARVRDAIVEAAVTVDIVDVGGGFPSVYPGMEPPELETYFSVIHAGFEALPVSYSAELWCEPGRALCAEYASLVVRVEKRRGDELYINDGAYGALFDAAHIGWRYPVRLLRETPSRVRPADFSFYGPPCDDLDHMAGPFALPADVDAGDYIEVGMLGAYGCAMRTGFNGFGTVGAEIVDDEPMASLYAPLKVRRSNVVKL